jgi:hypothetical protein
MQPVDDSTTKTYTHSHALYRAKRISLLPLKSWESTAQKTVPTA